MSFRNKIFLILVTILTQNVVSGDKELCLNGFVYPDRASQSFAAEHVKFCPGWRYFADTSFTHITKLVTISGSAFKTGYVRLIPHFRQLVSNESFHVQVSHSKMGPPYENYTMFFDVKDDEIPVEWNTPPPKMTTLLPETTTPLPELTTSALTTPSSGSYVTATLIPTSWQSFHYQDVRLYPGWTEVLKHSLSQTMVPGTMSNFTKHVVRVLPGVQTLLDVDGDQSMHARVYIGNAVDHVTIYLDYEIN